MYQQYKKVLVASGTLQLLVLSIIRVLAIWGGGGTLYFPEFLICNFLICNKAKHFSMLIGHWISCSVKCLFNPLDYFSSKLSVFLLICGGSLCHLNTSPSSITCYANVLCHYMAFFFFNFDVQSTFPLYLGHLGTCW